MNYWSAQPHTLPQQHPILTNKDYERTLLNPLNSSSGNNTPRNSYSSYGSVNNSTVTGSATTIGQLQVPSPHDVSQSPHYQYQQTLPRIYNGNANSNSITNNHTPLNVIPPLLNNSSIHETRAIITSTDDMSNNGNSPNGSIINDKNVLPLRLNNSNNSNANTATTTTATTNSSSPYLYHWRSSSNNNGSTSASNTVQGNSPGQHSPLYQLPIQSQALYKIPFTATSTTTNNVSSSGSTPPTMNKYQYSHVANASNVMQPLPLLQQHRSNSYPPRSSVTTVNGKNVVTVLGHNPRLNGIPPHHNNGNNMLSHHLIKQHHHHRLNTTGTVTINNIPQQHPGMLSNNVSGTHIHGCHLCEKSFKRKSWLKRHLLSHSAERHFLCPWCLSRHKRKDNLLQHMKLKHSSYLLDELRNHHVSFNWSKSSSSIPSFGQLDSENNLKMDHHHSSGNNTQPSNNNNIKNLLNEGVLNKEDVKRVLNKLIDQNNS